MAVAKASSDVPVGLRIGLHIDSAKGSVEAIRSISAMKRRSASVAARTPVMVRW
jgi:hypothetical protein